MKNILYPIKTKSGLSKEKFKGFGYLPEKDILLSNDEKVVKLVKKHSPTTTKRTNPKGM